MNPVLALAHSKELLEQLRRETAHLRIDSAERDLSTLSDAELDLLEQQLARAVGEIT